MPPPPTPPTDADFRARAFAIDCAGPNSLSKLARYEGSLERSMERNLRLLKAFQAARQTPPAAPPKEDDEVNSIGPRHASEDFSEVLHFAENAAHISVPAETLRNPLFVPPDMRPWTPSAGLRFSAPPAASL